MSEQIDRRERLHKLGSAGRSRGLIADADLQRWEGLKDWLQGQGYRVEQAADPWQAIQKMREDSFAVAIIAIDLPPVGSLPLSGWHLARICEVFNPGIAILLVARGYATLAAALAAALAANAIIILR